ncbi:LamG domain-containing protein [Halorubrum sp. LN27]|uniref:LamG domain-containing protein n=1 Tax=Halorubrum sp. LN27 TaxID=2801032 RepID=UPI00190C390A|nr:LamG domain-containing protein [Halorubrum sp. LN27]
MDRRNYIAMIGGVTGLGAAVGTGAFSSVEADRDVSVAVADENDAYLGMEPLDTPNGNQFATQGTANQIGLDFSDSGNDGSGVGLDSVYDFDDVFQITNQGTQGVYVWATFAAADGGQTDFSVGGSDTDVWLYADGESGNKLRDSADDVLYLSPGGSANIGVHVDTGELDSTNDQALTMTIRADANNPAEGDVIGGGGRTIAEPTDGLVSYWPLDDVESGTAGDAVGTNDGSVTGDVSAVESDHSGANFDADASEDQYVDLGSGSTFGFRDFTISAWARAPDGDRGLRTVVSRQDQDASDPWKRRTFVLWFDDNASNFGAEVITGRTSESDGDLRDVTADDEDYTDGNWHHIAMTVAADQKIALYVDGEFKGQEPIDGAPYTGDATTRAGLSPGQNRPLHGDIGGIRLYDRALDDDEVGNLYTATK